MLPSVIAVVKFTAAICVLWQIVSLAGLFIWTCGFTVMVNVSAGPSQVTPSLVKCGVTVMVAVNAAFVVFVAVKAAMSPLPLAARPMPVSSFVQE